MGYISSANIITFHFYKEGKKYHLQLLALICRYEGKVYIWVHQTFT